MSGNLGARGREDEVLLEAGKSLLADKELANRLAVVPPRPPSGRSARGTEQRVVAPPEVPQDTRNSIEDMEVSQLKVNRESSGMRVRERRSLRRILELSLARCGDVAVGPEVKSEGPSSRTENQQ